MEQYQSEFIEFLISQKALLFGTYTLKSGRISPYFFNAGLFDTSKAIALLGRYYAKAIVASGLKYDILFGPAYKGIPIVTSVAVALYELYGIDVPFCFNRKEAKPYGEGGNLVGSVLEGRVLVVDDVISSGTTFRESAELIAKHPTELVGVVTALDREEKGERTELTALEEIIKNYNVEVITIAQLSLVIDYMRQQRTFEEQVKDIQAYQEKYGKNRS